MKLPQTGGCQCGKIRYEINEAPTLVYTCHCRDCQRLTSSAFSLGIVVAEAGFRLSGIEPRPLQRMPDSGRVRGMAWSAFGRALWTIRRGCGRYAPRRRSDFRDATGDIAAQRNRPVEEIVLSRRGVPLRKIAARNLDICVIGYSEAAG